MTRSAQVQCPSATALAFLWQSIAFCSALCMKDLSHMILFRFLHRRFGDKTTTSAWFQKRQIRKQAGWEHVNNSTTRREHRHTLHTSFRCWTHYNFFCDLLRTCFWSFLGSLCGAFWNDFELGCEFVWWWFVEIEEARLQVADKLSSVFVPTWVAYLVMNDSLDHLHDEIAKFSACLCLSEAALIREIACFAASWTQFCGISLMACLGDELTRRTYLRLPV